jgi:hypothetical protein
MLKRSHIRYQPANAHVLAEISSPISQLVLSNSPRRGGGVPISQRASLSSQAEPCTYTNVYNSLLGGNETIPNAFGISPTKTTDSCKESSEHIMEHNIVIRPTVVARRAPPPALRLAFAPDRGTKASKDDPASVNDGHRGRTRSESLRLPRHHPTHRQNGDPNAGVGSTLGFDCLLRSQGIQTLSAAVSRAEDSFAHSYACCDGACMVLNHTQSLKCTMPSSGANRFHKMPSPAEALFHTAPSCPATSWVHRAP